MLVSMFQTIMFAISTFLVHSILLHLWCISYALDSGDLAMLTLLVSVGAFDTVDESPIVNQFTFCAKI